MSGIEKRTRGRPRIHDTPGNVPGVQALDRAVGVLRLVSEGDGLTLTEISEASGLPASTAYRILTTLHAHRMVEFDDPRQLWHMGVETFRMGASFLRRRKFVDRGREVMRVLQVDTGETANLAIADETEVVFVSQVETHEPIRAFFRPGARGDYHSSGIGKAILAFWEEDQVRELTSKTGLTPYTSTTHADIDMLLVDLRLIRARGWSVDDEERNSGMRCVAAPIFNEYAEPVAGVSISGPAVRVTPEKDDMHGARVARAAAEITDLIGGTLPD